MDCRHFLAVSVNVVWLACGCVGWQAQTRPTPPPKPPEAPPAHLIQKETPGPKKLPKAGTVVSLGAWQEGEAAKAGTPAHQQALRDEARKSYQEALRLDPANVPAYVGLGRVYTDLADYDRALDTYRKGLEKHPREIALWSGQGKCLARRKDFEQAARSFQKAVEIDPENRDALKQLGFCLARAGRIDESLPYLSRALGAANAHWSLACMTAHLGEKGLVNPQVARAHCRHHLQLALQANPSLTGAQRMLAELDGGGTPRATLQFDAGQ
jgi:tetratricopeptide (TPR) repeat protein